MKIAVGCDPNAQAFITLGSQVTGDMLGKELVAAYLDCTYVYNERSGKKVDAINDYDNAR